MKTLVKMKSTQMGKDDDSALTAKYNEGGEYQIGPDLLKAFERKGCVSVVTKPKPTKPQNLSEKEPVQSEKKPDPGDNEETDDSVLEQVKEKPKKTKKKKR